MAQSTILMIVKIKLSYRIVMCEYIVRPYQYLIKDDEVEIEIEFKGVWNVANYSGFSWKLHSSVFLV